MCVPVCACVCVCVCLRVCVCVCVCMSVCVLTGNLCGCVCMCDHAPRACSLCTSRLCFHYKRLWLLYIYVRIGVAWCKTGVQIINAFFIHCYMSCLSFTVQEPWLPPKGLFQRSCCSAVWKPHFTPGLDRRRPSHCSPSKCSWSAVGRRSCSLSRLADALQQCAGSTLVKTSVQYCLNLLHLLFTIISYSLITSCRAHSDLYFMYYIYTCSCMSWFKYEYLR